MEQQHYPLCGETERRWPSDSLYSRSERRWWSETEAKVPPGFIFTPNDEQLIVHYLHPYALRGEIPWDHVVEERVYEKEPCELLGHDRDDRYFFTRRTKCGYMSDRVKRTVGHGTWTGKAKTNIVSVYGKIIGFKTMLLYCVDGKSLGYTMYEYELPQSVTDNYMQEEGAPLQELVLCCVKKSGQKIAGSKKMRAEAAAPAAVVSSEQAHHDGAFEVGGEYHGCNSRAVVAAAAESITFSPENAAAGSVTLSCKASVAVGVTAANCSARPSRMYAADCNATPPMHLSAAGEASLEGRVHTEAINFASADQIMSSLAADEQPPACSGSYWTEGMINAVISDTCEAYELDMTTAEVVATAEHHSPPLSGEDGDHPTASAIYTGELGWLKLSNLRYSPPLPPFDWETSPPTDILPLFDSDVSWSSDLLKSPPESAPAGVAASAAADCSATPPMYLPAAAEALLEGRVNTETIKLASTDQIMSSSAVNQQPPAYNDGYRMMINADISDTCEGYELEMTTAEVAATSEHHLPPPSGQDGDQPTASATSAAEIGGNWSDGT